ncbi:NfeD family protein [Methylomicrobium lacus]|uniref:NfeD family protein n=1 Tax=Methylomicrobium lacus TaxID=136992 RepID=UPI0035A914A6
MRDVIQCLIDWLKENRNDVKAHLILRALAEESIKKAAFEENKRRFTGAEIVAAAGEDHPNANDWIDWNRTVVKYWVVREKQIIGFARKRGLDAYPKPERISTSGGPHLTTYFIKAEPLPDSKQLQEQPGKATEQQANIDYEITKAKPTWGAKWLFQNGQIRLKSWHIWLIIGYLLVLGCGAVALSYLGWFALSVPKPVTTRELTALISIFGIPYVVWIFAIKPWVRLFDDRIVKAPEFLVSINEKSAQLELLRDGDLRLIRLVRYSALCPICGAMIHLDDGSPDYPQRLVGRCYDSPREHMFSFDRVTQKGTVLRSPLI